MLLAMVVNTVAIGTSSAHLATLGALPSDFQSSIFNLQTPKDTVTRKKPRYTVRRTTVVEEKDTKKKSADLRDPDNVQTEVSYDEKTDTYQVGTTLGSNSKSTSGSKQTSKGATTSTKSNTSSSSASKSGLNSLLNKNQSRNATSVTSTGTASGLGYTASQQSLLGLSNSYLSAPLLMTPEEYKQWTLKQSMSRYFRDRNAELFESKGKSKFDFTDMKFDLGPAEKIFGPGGVQIKTQGSVELKLGMNTKKVNNPSLAANRRKASTSTRRLT